MKLYTITCGLEVHAELATKSKMFCRCANVPFGDEPNTHVCPVCSGMPGALPVPNQEAIRLTLLLGKALGSTLPKHAKFDRKHYFYPDLPKGYQISQYDEPFCVGGSLPLLNADGSEKLRVRFARVHLEEDAGKLLHANEKGYTAVDLNRAGVPLAEIVSEPDLHDPADARRFVQELRQLVRSLGVSEADMEKGQMRCDVNISIQFEWEGEMVSTAITEVKNVNSTRAVERSIMVEAQRLYDEWVAGGDVRTRTNKLTASWDETKGTVTIARRKESAADYRYFPEPDMPGFAVWEDPVLNPELLVIPELPNERRLRYLAAGVAMADTETLLGSEGALAALDAYLADGPAGAGKVATWFTNDPRFVDLSATTLRGLVTLVEEGAVSINGVKERFDEVQAATASVSTVEDVKAICEQLGLLQVFDASAVEEAVASVFAANETAVAQAKAGEQKLLGFLTGQALKQLGGKVPAAKVGEVVRAKLGM